MPSPTETSLTPHAFEHLDLYERLRTEGPGRVEGDEAVESLSHEQALALLYASWLEEETPLAHRQAQVWALTRHAGESRRSIATILGIAPQTVSEHLEDAKSKERLARQFSHLLEYADLRYFDYPTDARPTLPQLLAEHSWTYEHKPDDPASELVRHLVTYRWYTDARNRGEYHIETIDRRKLDTGVSQEMTSRTYSSLQSAITDFYAHQSCSELREAVVRWAVIRDACRNLTDSEETVELPSPTALVETPTDAGELLDFVDEDLITIPEAEAFASADDTEKVVSGSMTFELDSQ